MSPSYCIITFRSFGKLRISRLIDLSIHRKSELKNLRTFLPVIMATAEILNKAGKYGYIRFEDLEENKKYKVEELSIFRSTIKGEPRNCLKVCLEDGYLILPERYDHLVHQIPSMDVTNLYIVFNGRMTSKRVEVNFVEEN